jgi:hypothetical protein
MVMVDAVFFAPGMKLMGNEVNEDADVHPY